MKSLTVLASSLVFALVSANAQPMNMGKHNGMEASPGAAMQLTDGEVRKVNKEASELTLKHGDLPSIGMGPMTMVFRVADTKMLDAVKTGDKVRFVAEIKGGHPTVTRMEKAR